MQPLVSSAILGPWQQSGVTGILPGEQYISSSLTGNKTLPLCSPVNYYQGTEGSTECIACTAGTSTRGLTGQSKCQAVRSLRLAMF